MNWKFKRRNFIIGSKFSEWIATKWIKLRPVYCPDAQSSAFMFGGVHYTVVVVAIYATVPVVKD